MSDVATAEAKIHERLRNIEAAFHDLHEALKIGWPALRPSGKRFSAKRFAAEERQVGFGGHVSEVRNRQFYKHASALLIKTFCPGGLGGCDFHRAWR